MYKYALIFQKNLLAFYVIKQAFTDKTYLPTIATYNTLQMMSIN